MDVTKKTSTLIASMSPIAPPNKDVCPVLFWLHMHAEVSFPGFLSLVELANLQVTASLPLSALRLGQVWSRRLSIEFPRLTADPSCCENSRRNDLMSCYGPLRRAILAEGKRPIIRDRTEAKQLAKLLQGMEEASAKHISCGGHVTGILVGRFDIRGWTGGLLRGPATKFMLPSELTGTLGGSTAEVPIRLACAPNTLLIQLGELQDSQTQNRVMIMDVKGACAKGVLHYRQVSFKPSGKLNMACTGVHHFQQLEDGSGENDSVDVLCALFVRDGDTNDWKPTLLHALQLDESQQSPILWC